MSFEIDENTLMISGHKGDSASFMIHTKSDISDYNVHFYIKKHINDTENQAVLHKEFLHPQNGTIELSLTPEETNKLGLSGCCFKDYYWSLKIKGNDEFVQTVVPGDFVTVPIFRVYP